MRFSLCLNYLNCWRPLTAKTTCVTPQ